MGMLSKREQDAESKTLNPLARSLEGAMLKVLKNKVLSQLADEGETKDYYRRMFEESEWNQASERTIITSVPPADVRIHKFQRRQLNDYEHAVSEIKRKDAEAYQRKLAKGDDQKTGLFFANMGSVYDVPLNSSRADARTQADSSLTRISSARPFDKTERAVRKQPFDIFYTVNQTTEQQQEVKFTQQNRFEGRSSYFHYYPSDRLEQ